MVSELARCTVCGETLDRPCEDKDAWLCLTCVRATLIKPRNKHGNRRTRVDGIVFASGVEAQRYGELRLLERAGEISKLSAHDHWDLDVNGVHIGRYTADFSYYDTKGQRVVEDVKGATAPVSRDYPLRKKLMLALHGITIREVRR